MPTTFEGSFARAVSNQRLNRWRYVDAVVQVRCCARLTVDRADRDHPCLRGSGDIRILVVWPFPGKSQGPLLEGHRQHERRPSTARELGATLVLAMPLE